jgi:hypothetical protein
MRIIQNTVNKMLNKAKLEIPFGLIHLAGRPGQKLSQRVVTGRIRPGPLAGIARPRGQAAHRSTPTLLRSISSVES